MPTLADPLAQLLAAVLVYRPQPWACPRPRPFYRPCLLGMVPAARAWAQSPIQADGPHSPASGSQQLAIDSRVKPPARPSSMASRASEGQTLANFSMAANGRSPASVPILHTFCHQLSPRLRAVSAVRIGSGTSGTGRSQSGMGRKPAWHSQKAVGPQGLPASSVIGWESFSSSRILRFVTPLKSAAATLPFNSPKYRNS